MVRFKNRWLLVEFIQSGTQTATLDGKQIYAALKQSVIHNFGDAAWGAVAMSLTVKYFSPTTNVAIIRVARDHHSIAWGAVTLLTSIAGQRLIPNVVHLSGTIKHAQLAAIQHNRQVVARFRALANTPAMYQDSYDAFLDQSTKEIEALQD
ncbi:hypothetical protein BV22DRAFT_1103075 [Leucogyrophana mollusca]|uniref:Uncharacterized protein n=1 Tax=Leucogyrophana mollusca TaxID=85980 RepID=A0ACB8BSQ2_9AGAM|nr:hypothetical protein BV22DRAFT_1103075 [Leucogyrophana mollusca]